jgi:RNA polymerase-binding transcription factor
VDQQTIDTLRHRVEKDRENLIVQLTEMGVDPTTGTPDSVEFEQGFADSGQATAEKARILSIAEGLVESLREVEAALVRMDSGTFGRCESCGKDIPPDRLDARPVARLCLECKQRSG